MTGKAQQIGLNRRCGPFCGIAHQNLRGSLVDMPGQNRGELGGFSLFLLKSLMVSVSDLRLFSWFVPLLEESRTKIEALWLNWNIEDLCGIEGNGKMTYG